MLAGRLSFLVLAPRAGPNMQVFKEPGNWLMERVSGLKPGTLI